MILRLIPALLSVALATSLHAQSPTSSPVAAGDWPQWRGPDRDDISRETGLLKQWPEGGPKLLWTSNKAGLGYSGFSTSGGTLFTMGANENSEEELIALDAATGTEKWRTMVGARYANKWGDGPRSTPTVDGDRVYALGGKGDLICASAADGKTIWKTSLVTDHGGKIQSWGYTESVLVKGGHVYCTPGGPQGTVLALDKMTGTKVWQSADWTDPCQYASIIAVAHNGADQLIQLTMKTLAGVDAKDGKVLWQTPFPGAVAVIPTPIFKDGNVYVAAGYKVGCMMVNIGAGNSVTPVYQNTNMVNHHGGVILVGDHLYGHSDGGGWTCQDFKTGEVKWAEKKLGKGAIHCADGMLYLLEESNGTIPPNIALIEASPDGWKEHGRFPLPQQTSQRAKDGRVWVHPVVSHGRLYLRDQELIFCFDVKG